MNDKDAETKSLRLAFGSAVRAARFAAEIEDGSYNREPLRRSGDRVVSFTFKAALEDEVQAIVRRHGGYELKKAEPVWPPKKDNEPSRGWR
jgi:hypothetical protein